ncbi:MAG: PIG-L family deacetylase [Candidatus Omnitrophica bacterium]|nr:PIG-L family deacetylase [Candidatus Omnitrophota bacterium]MBU4478491.1 PIG-L family deacetylase [Candidatus Omnitrophota bacterium]MCG2704089.1 PIG-L family deacetylase [Candidatus Omnitrophota bacterium]
MMKKRLRKFFHRGLWQGLSLAVVFCLLKIAAGGSMVFAQVQDIDSRNEVVLRPEDRILVLAPHPDDEVIGCAGIIQHALKMKLPLKVVFLTYGDNNQWSFLVYRKHPVLLPKAVQNMGQIRYKEAIAAAEELGLSPEHLLFLGYPDFRTLNIWYARWAERPPARSMLTRTTSVPYGNAVRPGALYKGEDILRDLKDILRDFKPTKIFLSHPADHNGDHQTFYLFTRVALWDLKGEVDAQLYPYLVHFKRWPLPRGYRPQENITPPELFKTQCAWKFLRLSNKEVEVKFAALKKHWTQYSSSAKYLVSFVRENEMFGDFPVIPLSVPAVKDAPKVFSADRKSYLEEMPEELTDEEKALFVGIEERYMYLEDGNIVLSIKLSRPLAEGVSVSVYLFGYRDDVAFGKMPKLRLRFDPIKHTVYDQNRKLKNKNIKIVRSAKDIIIYVPVSELGNPQKILTSARTYSGVIPLDWLSWRTIELSSAGAGRGRDR